MPYQPPLGVVLVEIPASSFSGESNTALLNPPGGIFFSPAIFANKSNEILIDNIEACVHATDVYTSPDRFNAKQLLWGPHSSTITPTNDENFVIQPKNHSVVTVMVQTLPPGPTTIINII